MRSHSRLAVTGRTLIGPTLRLSRLHSGSRGRAPSRPHSQDAHKRGQGQYKTNCDRTCDRRVVKPEPSQTRIDKALGRYEARGKTHEIAEKEKQADPGMQYDVAEKRGGCRAERMLARMWNDVPDQDHHRADRREQHEGRQPDPNLRRAAALLGAQR